MDQLVWEKRKINYIFPREVKELLDNAQQAGEEVRDILTMAKIIAQLVKLFLLGEGDPLKIALIFLMDQFIELIEQVKYTGVYVFGIGPNYNAKGQYVRFGDILPGFEEDDERGFHMLSASRSIEFFVESFNNTGATTPPSSDGSYGGGLVIYAGMSGNVLEIMRKFMNICKLFGILFDHKPFLSIYKDLKDKLEIARNPGRKYTQKGKGPVWVGKKIFKMWPGAWDVLEDLQAWAEGFKDSVVTAHKGILQLIDLIDEKIKIIEELIELINEILFFIITVRDMIDVIEGFRFSVMYVSPQPGGVAKLINAVQNENLPNGPWPSNIPIGYVLDGEGTSFDEDFSESQRIIPPDAEPVYEVEHQMSILASAIGAGTGLSLLMTVLGYDETVTWGVEDELADDALQEKFKVGKYREQRGTSLF